MNVNLRLRTILEKARIVVAEEGRNPTTALNLADDIQELDVYLRSGGALPTAWEWDPPAVRDLEQLRHIDI